MIDRIDLVNLETEVRSLIGEEVAKFWTQDRVYRAINAEVMRLLRKVIGADNGYMERVETFAAAATIALPGSCYAVRNVEVYENGVWRQPDWINDRERGRYQSLGGSTDALAVQFFDGSLVFESGVGAVTSVRVKYARMPAAMVYTTVTSGSATSAVLAAGSSIDDVYNDDKFVVLAGAGVGRVAGRYRRPGLGISCAFGLGMVKEGHDEKSGER